MVFVALVMFINQVKRERASHRCSEEEKDPVAPVGRSRRRRRSPSVERV